ncbi:MAG: hypothetical protein AAFZ15_34685, partial [Bacteroidota bacterium]
MYADTFKNRIYHCIIFYSMMLFFPFSLHATNADWALTCPADISVDLMPNECNTSVVFDTAAWFSTEELVDTVFFPVSGSFFGAGTSVVTLAATTINGQLEVCNFNIIVNEFQPVSLDCEFNIEISLNGACERTFNASEILELDSAGCISNYLTARINALGEVTDPVITADDVGSPFIAVVQHQVNMTQCSTNVTVVGGTPPAISCPDDITIACNKFLLPSLTGIPDTVGCFNDLSITYFDDMALALCTDSISFQTTRSWVSTDPLGNIDVCEQVITGLRVDLSLIEFPDDYDGISQPVLHCSEGMTREEISDPVFTGEPMLGGFPLDANSHCDISVNFLDDVVNTCGAAYQIERVWTAVNLCDASDMIRDTQFIAIVDMDPPVFEVPDSVFVSTNSFCHDSILLAEVDIIQECSGFDVEIRTPWDTLNTNGGWSTIELIEGSYTILYTVFDNCGNLASRISNLIIEERTLVNCPPADTIDCDYYYGTIAPAIGFNDFETLNQLGEPEFHGNCNFSFTETDSISVDGCGRGVVVRTLSSDSIQMDECVQVVTVEHISNFSVEFPPSMDICEDPLEVDLGEPVVSGVSCENMVTEMFDEIIPSGTAGCYQIKRYWTITNACSYEDVNLSDDIELDSLQFMDGGDGVIEYLQIINVNERTGPTFPDDCGFPDLHVFQNNCEITVTVPTPEVEGCGNIDLSISGDLGEIMGESVNLVPGQYEMSFVAIDECGKIGTCVDTFAVLDTVGPVALCKPQIVVELLLANPSLIEVWADDLNDGSFDNCGGPVQSYFLTDTLVTSITYFCCDDGLHPVTVVFMDESGNQSTCNSSIVVQDNFGNCDECNPFLDGQVITETGIGMSNVEILIDDPDNGYSENIDVNNEGNYFIQLPEGGNYTVTPSKNDNHINGVTTFDAVILTRHILNVELLDSPYKIIAADINNSKTVTTFDVVEQRRLILNIYSNFPNNSSWRFVPEDFEFPNPLNPFE